MIYTQGQVVLQQKMSKWAIFIIALVFSAIAGLSFFTTVNAASGNGFDQYGYNNKARVFNGTGSSWCQGKLGMTKAACDSYMGVYANDKLIMKWNAAWDACNDSGYLPSACAGATLTNEWNGNVPGGSGDSEHFKAVWIGGNCGADGTLLADGGTCIWGQYEAIMDHGMVDGEHIVWSQATPRGFGVVRY